MNTDQIIDYISRTGLVGLLVGILWASFKRKWVWGSEFEKLERDTDADYEKLERERDKWQQMALRGISVAEKTVNLATPSPQ